MSSSELSFEPLPPDTTFKILFVYPNFFNLSAKEMKHMLGPQLGLLSLSACARRIGATTALCDLTAVPPDVGTGVIRTKIEQMQPDLVGVTATSNQWPTAAEVIKLCRELGVAHVVGGPHVTAMPEEAIEDADVLVIGEGEGALMDIVRAQAAGLPLAGIANTWVRDASGGVTRCEPRRLIKDLNELPLPDWKLFDRAHYLRFPEESGTDQAQHGAPQVHASLEGSRGCPYRCTFCSNAAFMEQYRGRGTWRREKSAARLLEELQAFRQTFGQLDYVCWTDEVFMTNKHRMEEFARGYRELIKVPFCIADRPENVTDAKVALMADAGLDYILIGMESGDEPLRRNTLNRQMSDETLRRAFVIPKAHGVKTYACCMLGLPGQDVKSMLQTWKMLRTVKADSGQFRFIHPKRGTRLYDDLVDRGMYDPVHNSQPYRHVPVIKHDLLDDRTLIRYEHLMRTYVFKPGIWSALAFHVGRHWDWSHDVVCRIQEQRHWFSGKWWAKLMHRDGKLNSPAEREAPVETTRAQQ